MVGEGRLADGHMARNWQYLLKTHHFHVSTSSDYLLNTLLNPTLEKLSELSHVTQW